MSLKGINFGKLNVLAQELQLNYINGQKVFGISYENMNNVSVNKNDIIIQTITQQVGNDDCMCQIRFFVDEPKDQNSMDEQNEENKQKQVQQKQSQTQKLYKQILEKAKIGEFAGQSIATLNDVNLAVPRGKYTIDFYKKYIRLHGSSYSYNVDYKNIMKGFILPMSNESQVSIVLQLNKDKPIYQGQTVYRYIVIQVKKDLELQIKPKVNPDILQELPHLKQIKSQYNGYLFQVFVDLIQVTSKISMIHPGNNFKSKDGQPCVKCNVKAQPGWIYMLKQSLIFISKPVIYFKTDDIKSIQFVRVGASNKQFDMKITIKQDKRAIQFMGIQRPELENLVEYFKSRNVKVDMEVQQQKVTKILGAQLAADDQDESEDEDFDGDVQDDDDDESSSQSESGESQSKSKSKSKNGKQGKQGKKKQAKQQE